VRYTAILNGKERRVEVKHLDNHRYQVIVDGNSHIVDARQCAPEWISFLVDNHSYDISFSQNQDRIELNFRNQYFSIEVLDERKMRMRRIRSDLDLSGPEVIKTSMPGKVVKLLVKSGDKVKAGTGIIIIEAMKMENEIKCKKAGVVSAINVKNDQTVESGSVLVEIEPLK
jgi:biotin carboxyl carrier protein